MEEQTVEEEPVKAEVVTKRQRAAAEAAATMDLMPVAGETDVLRSLYHLADAVKDTEFVPKGLRGSTGKVLAAILTGRELGVGPMSALKHVHIIEGKPGFSAALQLALIRRDGHNVTGQATSEKAEVHGVRADNGDTMDVVWTLDMALKAGLVDKIEDGKAVARARESGKAKPWERYTHSMLWARAVTQLADQLFPDVIVGGMPTRIVSEPVFDE